MAKLLLTILLLGQPSLSLSSDRAHLLQKVKSRLDSTEQQTSGACAAAGQRQEMSLCAPLGTGCMRPPGLFHLAMRSTGSYVIAKNLLDTVFPKQHIRWGDCLSLGDSKAALMFGEAKQKGWLKTVSLRDPVERIVAQYFQSFPRREWLRLRGSSPFNVRDESDLATWIAMHSAPTPRRGNDGKTHLVFELDNLYTKVLSGYDGRTGLSVGLAELEAAKQALEKFDLVFIVEWLSSPMFIRYASKLFCFRATPEGNITTMAELKFRHHKGNKGDVIPVPDLRRARVTDLRGPEKVFAEEVIGP